MLIFESSTLARLIKKETDESYRAENKAAFEKAARSVSVKDYDAIICYARQLFSAATTEEIANLLFIKSGEAFAVKNDNKDRIIRELADEIGKKATKLRSEFNRTYNKKRNSRMIHSYSVKCSLHLTGVTPKIKNLYKALKEALHDMDGTVNANWKKTEKNIIEVDVFGECGDGQIDDIEYALNRFEPYLSTPATIVTAADRELDFRTLGEDEKQTKDNDDALARIMSLLPKLTGNGLSSLLSAIEKKGQ